MTEELVVVGSDARPQAHLYAFDRATGAVRWKHPFPGGVTSSVHRHGDTALAAAVSGEVVAVALADGTRRWHVDDPPPGTRGNRNGDPALAGGRLFVPWRPGAVDALDAATGERRWRRRLDGTLSTSAAVVGSEVWVGSAEGELFRLRAADGEPLGRRPQGGALYGDLTPAGECVLAQRAEGESGGAYDFSGPHALVCLDPASGAERWAYRTPGEWGTFRPLVRGGEVIAGVEGRLLGLALADGRRLWERPVRGLPRAVGDSATALYVGTLDGEVLALPWRPPPPQAQEATAGGG